MTLVHGGNLAAAAARFGIPREQWLDLSTGISPWSWPVPPLPETVWNRLPELDGELEAAAAAYYGTGSRELLAVPGSQYAIARIPGTLTTATAALPLWGYREHEAAWQRAGHRILHYRDAEQLAQLVRSGAVRHAVVINPCNPTAETAGLDRLTDIASGLQAVDGMLVVDEAFMDTTPENSLLSRRPPNTVVLRSVGKFFGLAGLRLGFVVAERPLLAELGVTMDPWAVNHPARWIGTRALADRTWQRQQRRRLAVNAHRWSEILAAVFPGDSLTGSSLFTSLQCDWHRGRALYASAGRHGLLLRLIGPHSGSAQLRFGHPLPEHYDTALARLYLALGDLTPEHT
ncbi:MAG: threonine-phosphate decarboxylase [Haliea sp.]|nr:threonine-phosphate decarboxylase [Haliea sp.]|tara:strand:- start:70845 stop:71879 length:1035 start_codon:yes stop_codon:yes gene_type:complete